MRRHTLADRKLASLAKASFLANGLNSPETAHFWGFFLTDGYCDLFNSNQNPRKHYVRWNLKYNDYGWLQRFVTRVSGGVTCPVGIFASKRQSGTHTFGCTAQLFSKPLSERVMQISGLNSSHQKTFDLEFPEMDPHLIPHFIQGLLEGDGCISLAKNGRMGITFVSANQLFIENLKVALETHCFEGEIIPCTVRSQQYQTSVGSGVQYYLRFGQRSFVTRFLRYIYERPDQQASSEWFLPRKLKRAEFVQSLLEVPCSERFESIAQFKEEEKKEEQRILDDLISLAKPLIADNGVSKSLYHPSQPFLVFYPSFLKYVQNHHMIEDSNHQ